MDAQQCFLDHIIARLAFDEIMIWDKLGARMM
jgi:hypothetical protein